MKAKIAFLALSLTFLMLVSPTVKAAETGTLKYTDGLKVGDKLVYKSIVDDTFSLKSDFKDGEKRTFELTTAYSDTSGTLDSLVFTTVTYDIPGTWKITFDNGTVKEDQKDPLIVLPTSFELDNGTSYNTSATIGLVSGIATLGGVSESDGEVKIHIAFLITLDLVYEAKTGILQSMTILDNDGEGEAKMVLESGGAGGLDALPAYDLPVFIALTAVFATYSILRRRR